MNETEKDHKDPVTTTTEERIAARREELQRLHRRRQERLRALRDKANPKVPVATSTGFSGSQSTVGPSRKG